MIRLTTNKVCGHPGCSKGPSYGEAGGTKREFCAQHAPEGMVNLNSLNHNRKQCKHPSCTKQPSYGAKGTTKREFCAQHALDGMVDIHNKRCEHQGCGKGAAYGSAGSGKQRQFCSQHAKDGMINRTYLGHSKRCGHPGCPTHPSFGIEGSTRREFCAKHAKEGMISHISSKRCGSLGCKAVARYGVEGSMKREFCSEHAKGTMVDLTRKRCGFQGCNEWTLSAGRSTKPKFCAQHTTEDTGNTSPNRIGIGSGADNACRAGAEGKRKKPPAPSTTAATSTARHPTEVKTEATENDSMLRLIHPRTRKRLR